MGFKGKKPVKEKPNGLYNEGGPLVGGFFMGILDFRNRG